jgi:hypothetical protein
MYHFAQRLLFPFYVSHHYLLVSDSTDVALLHMKIMEIGKEAFLPITVQAYYCSHKNTYR